MKKAFLLATSLLLVWSLAAFSQTAAKPKYHVVFQMSEAEGPAWNSLVLHVNNTMKSLAETGGAEVEVVFYGPGLLMLTQGRQGI